MTLPPLRYGALALSTAAYLKPNIYLLGGVNRKFYNTQVYRYDTTTLTWLTDNLKAAGSFTPRVGLSSTILNGVIVTAGGHTGTGGTSKYSGAFEMLEIDRAAGKDTELKWHQGPDMQFPRGKVIQKTNAVPQNVVCNYRWSNFYSSIPLLLSSIES